MGRGTFLAEAPSFGTVGIVYKGYDVNSQIGTRTIPLQQPGNQRKLVGCALFATDPAAPITTERVSLIINSNQVLDNIPALAICPQGLTGHANNGMPFFVLNRALQGGQDEIQFTVTGTAVKTIQLVLYYSPE
jgi:hypothetical protein